MSSPSDPKDPPAEDVEGQRARLGVQAEAIHAVLVRLLQDAVQAESVLERGQAAGLAEVNERLVVAAMVNDAKAEAAGHALERAEESAALDALTRLPNRATFLDRFQLAVAHSRRHGLRLALLFVDLDGFKRINDAFGHAFGDRVLCLVAERMSAVVRGVDTVSRHGGDEFLILLTELSEPGDARAAAEKLVAAVGAPFELEGRTTSVGASVGISIYPDDGEDADTLIAHADAAMYEAKRSGAGGIAFHGAGSAATSWQPALARAPANPPQPQSAREEGESRRRQAALREANEKLLLAALSSRELQVAAEQAKQRQTAFLAAVADELVNPMAPIRIAASMLGGPRGVETLLPSVQGVLAQRLADASRAVDKLVGASRADPSGIRPEFRRVDMAAVIDAAVAAQRPTMDERGQWFESTRPPGMLGVQGDPALLQQIVGSLLDNASSHTREGGRIRLSAAVTDDTLTLTVSDDGVGIAPQMLPHVFEPFVRDVRALGLYDGDPGISLAAVRALVRAHGGSVVAHSAGAGRGSRFVVTLALASSGPPTPDAHSGSEASGPSGPVR